jgi:transposase
MIRVRAGISYALTEAMDEGQLRARGFTPVYRQSQIFARHGVEIERSTLANWVGGACYWLEPLQVRLAAHVFMLKGRI